METSDKRIFAENLIGMGEVYDRKISPAAAAIYFDDLKDYPLADVLAAFSAHRKDSDRGRFFPKVADLLDKLQATTEQTAMLAWSEMLPLLKDSQRAISADPVTERVIQDLGGWTRVAHTDTDKLVWVEKEFVRRYQMYSEHGVDVLRIAAPRGLRRIGVDS